MTMKSGAIASRLRAVSSSVSPLTKLDADAEKFIGVGGQPLLGQLEGGAACESTARRRN